MAYRIRYNKTVGVAQAYDSNHIMTSNRFVYIRLFPTMNPPTFRIYNAANDELISEDTSPSVVALKKAAKRAVVALGASFGKERRTLLPMDNVSTEGALEANQEEERDE